MCVWRVVRYAAEVIGEALLSVGREGYRRVAERLGVPGETVRDWRRRFRSRAEVIAAHFLRWARALDASFDPPAGQGSLVRMRLRRSACACVWRRCCLFAAAVVVGVGADRWRAVGDQHGTALACAGVTGILAAGCQRAVRR